MALEEATEKLEELHHERAKGDCPLEALWRCANSKHSCLDNVLRPKQWVIVDLTGVLSILFWGKEHHGMSITGINVCMSTEMFSSSALEYTRRR